MTPFRQVIGIFSIFCIIAVLIPSNALTCLDARQCSTVRCARPEGCKHGFVKNPCACCEVCAKGLGEECAGVFGQLGQCGEGLDCEIDTTSSQRPGKCVAKVQTTTQPA